MNHKDMMRKAIRENAENVYKRGVAKRNARWGVSSATVPNGKPFTRTSRVPSSGTIAVLGTLAIAVSSFFSVFSI